MTNVLKEMFDASTVEASKESRALEGTAQLTAVAHEVTAAILTAAAEDVEKYRPLIEASKESHGAMDAFIGDMYDLSVIDIQFLKELSVENLEKMLRSQQSKRSRSKSKTMTMENYRSFMDAAVSELLLRRAIGKDKNLAFADRRVGRIEFTDEELAMLEADQGQLRREIRNIQSKKSIAKAKEDFSEESEAWQQLLVVEEKLKSIRREWTPEPKVDKTQGKLSELLGDIDPDSLKAADAKELLARIKELA